MVISSLWGRGRSSPPGASEGSKMDLFCLSPGLSQAGLSEHLIQADVSGDVNDKCFSSQGILCCNPWPRVTWFRPKGVELMGQKN